MNIAIILSAGKGTRMHSSEPKQFLLLDGAELFGYPLTTFYEDPDIDEIVLVVAKGYENRYQPLLDELKRKPIHLINGGSTRSESSFLALQYLKNMNRSGDVVLIHDVARPLLSHRIILDNIKAAGKNRGVLTYLPFEESVFSLADDRFVSSLPRDSVGIAQTPQTFILDDIYEAYKNVSNSEEIYTDDIQVFKTMFDDVVLIKGDKANLKVTTKDDLKIMRSLLSDSEVW